jgi:hypothetical protein
MQVQTQTRSGNPALQYGLLFGVILGAIEVVFSLTLGNVGFLISLIFYLGIIGVAGYRASARTGKVSTGLVAGLLAGLFSSIIGSLGLFIYILPNIDAFRQALQQNATTLNQGFTINYTNNVVIGLLVLVLVFVIIGSSLLALGIGSIGGAIGKGNAPVPPPPYPYPGQYPDPRYMPPPAYPPQEFIPPQNYPPSPQDYMSPPPEK